MQRSYQRQWMARRRAAFMYGKSCVDCGATVNLEIDHRPSESKWTHRVWSYRQELRDAELAKVDVRCRSCHQQVTLLRGQFHVNAKLDAQDVFAIRMMRGRIPARELAELFGVTRGTIDNVLKGRTWRHLPLHPAAGERGMASEDDSLEAAA